MLSWALRFDLVHLKPRFEQRPGLEPQGVPSEAGVYTLKRDDGQVKMGTLVFHLPQGLPGA